MAAYGALVSVMYIIDQIRSHPHPPISLHQKQVESLIELVTFLQDFLEGYSSHVGYTEEEDYWESQIAEAAYHAEDVIESYIANQILVRSRNYEENISSDQFYQGVEKVLENMNLIKTKIKEKMVVQDQLHIMKPLSTTRSTTTAQNVIMIGFDEVFYQMLDKITGGGLGREIIPIVGMGGIGKTTLARNIYVSPLVQESFDVCVWLTISQEYNAWQILGQVLDQVGQGGMGDLREDELGEHLYKYLIGRKYFIVMDDMWNIEAWDQIRRFIPDNRNGSRLLVTTRLSNLASHFNYSNGLDMKFLDGYASWSLFSKIVFGEESCPLELEDIGRKIVKGCKGLPLPVAVIGGLLAKSERTKENWSFIEKNLSSIVNSGDSESCLQVLYISYSNLPVHLKPCFLYMGRYGEDYEIKISMIIPYLVAEGFLKPIKGKTLEEVAIEYLEELVDRNLLIVENHNSCGKLKSLKMHDLLRDLCLREGKKLRFFGVLGEKGIPQAINSQRRILSTLSKYPTQLIQSLESASLVRSFIGVCPNNLSYNFRLLRTYSFDESSLEGDIDEYHEDFLGLVNLRLLVVYEEKSFLSIPSSVSYLWNLQTLILGMAYNDFVFKIWKMPLLRHVKTYPGTLDGAYFLPDPLSNDHDMVLENLHTLSKISNLKFGEGVLKKIANIKKLKLEYLHYGYEEDGSGEEDGPGQEISEVEDGSGEEDNYCLNNLCRLHKLETLRLEYNVKDSHLVREVSFPYYLKKLTLVNTKLPWEDMSTKIGSLPLLQVLKLENNSFSGSEWETSEDQFLNLKFLLIHSCDIECWNTDNTHFPRLEHLNLECVKKLREIPLCIGDIPTLQSINVRGCSDSVNDSARRIKEEQEDLCNEGLQIKIIDRWFTTYEPMTTGGKGRRRRRRRISRGDRGRARARGRDSRETRQP